MPLANWIHSGLGVRPGVLVSWAAMVDIVCQMEGHIEMMDVPSSTPVRNAGQCRMGEGSVVMDKRVSELVVEENEPRLENRDAEMNSMQLC
jgi:hypothetical protein